MIKKLILKIFIMLFICSFITACKEKKDYVSLSDEITQKDIDNKQDSSVQDETSENIVVYVHGAVKKPGVYVLHSGDRVYQAVDMAGGMTSDAEKRTLNLAETVSDEQDIYIMTKKEYDEKHESNDKEKQSMSETLVNINTADSKMLMSLQGIGEAKAASIIAYREENGLFTSKEDIKKVSGIGDSTYSNIKDLITIE